MKHQLRVFVALVLLTCGIVLAASVRDHVPASAGSTVQAFEQQRGNQGLTLPANGVQLVVSVSPKLDIESSFDSGWQVDSIEHSTIEVTTSSEGARAWLASIVRT